MIDGKNYPAFASRTDGKGSIQVNADLVEGAIRTRQRLSRSGGTARMVLAVLESEAGMGVAADEAVHSV